MRHETNFASGGTVKKKAEDAPTLEHQWLDAVAARKLEILQMAFGGAADEQAYLANRMLRLEHMIRERPESKFLSWAQGGEKPEAFDLKEFEEQGFLSADGQRPHDDVYTILGMALPHAPIAQNDNTVASASSAQVHEHRAA